MKRYLYKNQQTKKINTKFFILCTARTGSNYLLSLLSRNPSIFSYDELFNLSSLPKNKLVNVLTKPIEYLTNALELTPDRTNAVGFKMFYYHATKYGFGNNNPYLFQTAHPKFKNRIIENNKYIKKIYNLEKVIQNFNQVWTHLKEKNYSIIHLKRKNLLKSYISLKKAYISDNWTKSSSTAKQNIEINVNYKECLNYFKKITAYENYYDLFFKDCHKTNIYYEDLIRNKDEEIAKLYKFLSVSQINKSLNNSSLLIQETKPLSKTIKNYLLLKEKFANTKWKAFFEE